LPDGALYRPLSEFERIACCLGPKAVIIFTNQLKKYSAKISATLSCHPAGAGSFLLSSTVLVLKKILSE
jgi:hypothetical protein